MWLRIEISILDRVHQWTQCRIELLTNLGRLSWSTRGAVHNTIGPGLAQRIGISACVAWTRHISNADVNVERAREEDIHASVLASDGATNFYLKCGFEEVVGNASRKGGEANPMVRANVKVGDMLFT